MNNQNDLSEAKILAAVVARGANFGTTSTSIQRSHRFPLHLLTYIESMADMGGVSVSLVINQLLEAGLEAVKKEFSEETKKSLHAAQAGRVQAMSEKLTKTKPRS